MDTLQRWLAQKGDNAANALSEVLTSLGYSPDAVITAIEADQRATRLTELAASLAAEGVDETELATEIAAKKAAKPKVVEEK